MTSLATQFTSHFEMRPRRLRTIGLVLLGLAVVTCGLGLLAFPNDDTAPAGWLPYLASGICFIAACYFLFPYKQPENRPAPITRLTLIILLVILGLAAFMRFYNFSSVPFGTWWDEADIGQVAKRILSDPNFRPFFVENNDHPLHFFSLIALSFQLFGVSTTSIRLVTVMFGLATVLLAFLAGREMYGNRFGLLFAFFFAISRWHVTFSRFGVYTISLPFFEVLVIWLLLRARRTGQLHDFAWAGLMFGLSVNFYIGIRLFVGVILVYLAYWLLTALFRRKSEIQPELTKVQLISGLIAFILGTWFTFAPNLEFAVSHPDIYWGRSSSVSIFNQRDEADLPKALMSNITKHLLMFNYQGDNNGRHNLPGEPMLDPILGVLFVLGAVLALSRFYRPNNFLMLMVFGVNLLGGILTLDFEAPQSNRAFGSIVAVLYFSALAAETLWRGLDKTRLSNGTRQTLLAAAVGLGGFIVYYNAQAFFVRQQNNDRVWTEYSGVETLTAHKMLEVDPDHTSIYASVFLNNYLVIQFLAPQIHDSKVIVPPNGLPIHEAGDKPVAIFVDQDNTWIIDEAKKYYPDADYQTYTTPQGNPALSTILIPPQSIQQLQGVTVSYWPGDTPQGTPQVTLESKAILVSWPREAPVAAPFVAQWDSTLYAAQYGNYKFVLKSPQAATLWIDNQQISTGSGEQQVAFTLAQGDHLLRVQATGADGAVTLAWQRPDSPNTGDPELVPSAALYLPARVPVQGLLGTYYNGETEGPEPAFTQVNAYIDMYFHLIPLPRPYTINWTGQINIPTEGDWAFGLRINGQAEVFVDNQSVVNATAPTEYLQGNRIHLTAGWHPIRIHYLDSFGGSRIHLSWVPPEGPLQIVPSSALLPYPAK